jgi:hypothetical protein
MDGNLRVCLARVPEVPLIAIELLAFTGDEDLVGSLLLRAPGPIRGLQDPAEARLRNADANRILQILALKLHWLQRTLPGGLEARGAETQNTQTKQNVGGLSEGCG